MTDISLTNKFEIPRIQIVPEKSELNNLYHYSNKWTKFKKIKVNLQTIYLASYLKNFNPYQNKDERWNLKKF